MEIINFAESSSLVGQYMAELRDVSIQQDRMRFRRNLERIGQIMAYEISKRLPAATRTVTTPLGTTDVLLPGADVVLATILRAGMPMHQGFLDFMDHAENAFVSAYRRYIDGAEEFEICAEYLASPGIDGKVLVLVDPMLATGSSMDVGYRTLLTRGTPSAVHIASVVASRKAVDYISRTIPEATLWVGAIDPELNPHSYIVPGLGDAGDLAYGTKL